MQAVHRTAERDAQRRYACGSTAYLTDEEDPRVIDFDKMKVKAERLAAYCGQNPEMSLMTAAENVMGK